MNEADKIASQKRKAGNFKSYQESFSLYFLLFNNILRLYKKHLILFFTYSSNRFDWANHIAKSISRKCLQKIIGQIQGDYFPILGAIFSLKIVMRCAIWYHLYNLRNMKNTHEGVLLLVKLQAFSLQLHLLNTPPWVFFHVL